jgi:formate C-acetyltransferase
MVLRRAKAMAKLLDNMTIYILPHERIVGNIASKPSSLITYPELFWRWLDKAIDADYKELLSEEEREELHTIHKYWKNKAVHGMERDLLPEQIKPYWFYNNHGVYLWIHGGRTGVPNYYKLFQVGLKGIISEAKERLAKLSADPACYLQAIEYLSQKRFLEAVIIVSEAAIRFGQRFAEKARELSEKEENGLRRKELEEIAEICSWVPANPPRGLYEALQCYWFITLITRILDLQTPGLGDRFDQIMYPFYQRDKEAGRLSREEAQELVEHLWLKMNEEGQLIPPVQGAGGGGLITARVLTIGGQTPTGEDATNEMSYIVLDASKAVRLTQPAIAIRLHRHSPKEFLLAITDALRMMAGLFSFFNDEMMIPYLVNLGLPMEDARDYSTEGCMRWIIPGKAMGMRALGGMFALPKCLEYALNQGIDKFSGKQMGYPTPDPCTFSSIEDVIEAYLTQVRFFTEKLVTIYNLVDVLDGEYLPQPFLSALLDGCLERGQDCRDYKYFPNTIIQPVGQVTVVNSLVALKKLVFEDKKISMAELVEAMRDNWAGKEVLRQMCLNAPKFGNDDDYVDRFAADLYLRTTKVFRSFKNIWGGSFLEDGTGGSSYYSYSGLTGATPDGRKDRDLFNDGTVSPTIGSDKRGPTAVLQSVAKIDHAQTFTHLLNQKILPLYLSPEHREVFMSYLRTWINLGIHHIQFNVIDRQILLDAQDNPENYGDLIVRVAGFSAYYVDMEKEVQDQIIARTEQALA